MGKKYMFQEEIIRAVLNTFVEEINDENLTEKIYNSVEFEDKYYGSFLYVNTEDIDGLAEKISSHLSESKRIKNEHKINAFAGLTQHENCQSIIKDLTSMRNELISAICDSRNYCFYDSDVDSSSKQIYMDLDFFVAMLRPRLTLYGETPRSLPDPEGNDVDYFAATIPDDDERAEELDNDARIEIASHTCCSQIGYELYNHIDNLTSRIEAAYERAKSLAREKYDEVVTPTHGVLPLLKIKPALYGDINMPKSLTATIYPTMDDPDYCVRGETNSDEYHSYPHRACHENY